MFWYSVLPKNFSRCYKRTEFQYPILAKTQQNDISGQLHQNKCMTFCWKVIFLVCKGGENIHNLYFVKGLYWVSANHMSVDLWEWSNMVTYSSLSVWWAVRLLLGLGDMASLNITIYWAVYLSDDKWTITIPQPLHKKKKNVWPLDGVVALDSMTSLDLFIIIILPLSRGFSFLNPGYTNMGKMTSVIVINLSIGQFSFYCPGLVITSSISGLEI